MHTTAVMHCHHSAHHSSHVLPLQCTPQQSCTAITVQITAVMYCHHSPHHSSRVLPSQCTPQQSCTAITVNTTAVMYRQYRHRSHVLPSKCTPQQHNTASTIYFFRKQLRIFFSILPTDATGFPQICLINCHVEVIIGTSSSALLCSSRKLLYLCI